MRWKPFVTPFGTLSPDEARTLMSAAPEAGFQLVDVRQPAEYQQAHIAGAKLVPLAELQDRVAELDPDLPTVLYCAAGVRSHAAAQLLAGAGFDRAYNLLGGINAWRGGLAVGDPTLGLERYPTDASVEELLVAAYGMEEGLASFYETLARETKSQRVRGLLAKLGGAEEDHKEQVLGLYRRLVDADASAESLEARADSSALEGGLSAEEYLSLFRFDRDSERDVLSLAMLVEGQALDLFTRAAARAEGAGARELLLEMAEEEKNHLALVASLMDEVVAEG